MCSLGTIIARLHETRVVHPIFISLPYVISFCSTQPVNRRTGKWQRKRSRPNEIAIVELETVAECKWRDRLWRCSWIDLHLGCTLWDFSGPENSMQVAMQYWVREEDNCKWSWSPYNCYYYYYTTISIGLAFPQPHRRRLGLAAVAGVLLHITYIHWTFILFLLSF